MKLLVLQRVMKPLVSQRAGLLQGVPPMVWVVALVMMGRRVQGSVWGWYESRIWACSSGGRLPSHLPSASLPTSECVVLIAIGMAVGMAAAVGSSLSRA